MNKFFSTYREDFNSETFFQSSIDIFLSRFLPTYIKAVSISAERSSIELHELNEFMSSRNYLFNNIEIQAIDSMLSTLNTTFRAQILSVLHLGTDYELFLEGKKRKNSLEGRVESLFSANNGTGLGRIRNLNGLELHFSEHNFVNGISDYGRINLGDFVAFRSIRPGNEDENQLPGAIDIITQEN